MNQTTEIKTKVLIVGAGFSGLCMGIKLKEAHISDFVILEKAAELGGTWRENTYPGAECDIPSSLYSYSFAHNPKWKFKWSGQEQILDYQRQVADTYQLKEHFRFGQKVIKANYDSESQQWSIECESGEHYRAQHFVSAVGQLHEPSTPEFTGLDQFNGALFHAAQWDHGVTLDDKRVAVVGSAASAVQLIPELAEQAAELTVFQRSPNWMLPKNNRRHSKLEQWLLERLPPLQMLYRVSIWLQGEFLLFNAIKGKPIMQWLVKQRALFNIRKHIDDPALRQRLTPNYTIGAKRILFSHTFYEALNKAHVHLQTEGIKSFNASGIESNDGQQHNIDVVVFATGFKTNPFLASMNINGVDTNGNKKLLSQHWEAGAQAYLGVHTHGFPNFHLLYGPNTNLGHNSIIIMIEAQANYIVNAITTLDKNGKSTIEVSQAVERDYNITLQQRLADMAFSQVEQSWYMQNGKVTNNWAGNTIEYRRRLKELDWSAYKAI